jgi:hypothetical protein
MLAVLAEHPGFAVKAGSVIRVPDDLSQLPGQSVN